MSCTSRPCRHTGCEDPCIGAGDAKTTGPGSAAPSYWQLLAAQYGTTGHQQRASSAHGTFLLSAAKALRLAVHLMNNAAVYQGCLEAADKDPAGEAPFIEVPVQDIVRHGLYGIKSLDSRQLALVTGLALDCEARRHELGFDEAGMCIRAPDRSCVLMRAVSRSSACCWLLHRHALGLRERCNNMCINTHEL